MVFCEKIFCSKSLNLSSLLWSAYQFVLFPKNVFFRLNYEVLLAKIRNVLKLDKLKSMMGAGVFLRKKNVVIILKAFSAKMGERENMPAVAGCLVLHQLELEDWSEFRCFLGGF